MKITVLTAKIDSLCSHRARFPILDWGKNYDAPYSCFLPDNLILLLTSFNTTTNVNHCYIASFVTRRMHDTEWLIKKLTVNKKLKNIKIILKLNLTESGN